MKPRRAAASAVAVAAAAALGGCGGVTSLAIAPPPPVTGTPTTTVAPLPDLAGVVERPVAGETTTTTPAVGPGGATVSGTVTGPSGPVAGATVEADRIVGGKVAATDATTAADGTFTIPDVLGGIYRVRAWQAPALAMTTPDVFFLAGDATRQVQLTLSSYTALQVSASIAPGSVVVGGDVDVAVAVDAQVVGTDGVVRPMPSAGQTVQVAGAGWSAIGPDPAVTDTTGQATVELSCTSPGTGPVVAAVAGAAPAQVTATCYDLQPDTTTTAPPDTASTLPPDTGPGATTSTTTPPLSP